MRGPPPSVESIVPQSELQPIPTASSPAPVNEILVALALCISACLSIWATRVPGGIAQFWPGSAIAAAILIRLPQVRWSFAAPGVLLAVFFANVLVAHRPWPDAALFAGVNGIEIALMVVAFRFVWAFPYPNISVNQA